MLGTSRGVLVRVLHDKRAVVQTVFGGKHLAVQCGRPPSWRAKGLRLSVAEIAAQVGYANQSKFAKVFREKYGVEPIEYRRTVHLGAFHLPHGAL